MSEKTTILVIDDDPSLVRLIEFNLEQADYTVFTAYDGPEGLRKLYEKHPDLIILDINMPGMDGWTTCQRIREVSEVPIIMLTADSEPESIVKGLDLGADDYIIKPFEVKVLVARVKANIRRSQLKPTTEPQETANNYHDDYISINLADRRVLINGELVKLTKTEFGLLAELLRVSPRIALYRNLLENVWGFEYINDIDYLRVYIWHLRRKIEPDAKNPKYIINEQGVGYRFEKRHGLTS